MPHSSGGGSHRGWSHGLERPSKNGASFNRILGDSCETIFGKDTIEDKDAMYGWYKYESRFALPVFGSDGEIERYNVFHAAMIFRHAQDGKKYLYDIMNIKKETTAKEKCQFGYSKMFATVCV